jgi:aspartyl-tRNA(Asn)/glutamyl-tRNA(Gln) amidotransferase subunit B
MEFEAVIGLEVHVQLTTRTKMFCGCPNLYGAPPNTQVCPVCLGLPGALPVPNEEAIIRTILAGRMLGSQIARRCRFDRKNYFYPDMPKNYQISQYQEPLCRGGALRLHLLAFPKDAQKEPQAQAGKCVRLVRIHLEEDVAKSFHWESQSGIDFNRAGAPLLEIVTEPDLNTPEEAFAFLTALRQILRYGGVSDAEMEKGQLRCDVNVSVRPKGSTILGTKCEIKNLNSSSAVRKALRHEIAEQIRILEAGGTISQRTLRWDEAQGRTIPMRRKEQAHDYRYFPDPDLLVIRTDQGLLEEAQRRIPELPEEKKQRLMEHYGLSEYQAWVLASDPGMSAYYEQAAADARNKVAVANFLINDYLALADSVGEFPVPPVYFSELVNLLEEGKIHSRQAKEILVQMVQTKQSPKMIVEQKGVAQITDPAALEELCRQALRANPKSVADYRLGKQNAIHALRGYVMKLSKGQANPKLVGEILERIIHEESNK